MKKGYLSIITTLLFAILAGIVSCNTNPCSDVLCLNNGTCREGACACPSGFEGNFCQNKSGDKFIGYWEGFKRINGGVDVKTTLIISPNAKSTGEIIPNEIIIYALSFSGNYVPVVASCLLTDLTIPQQTVSGNSGYAYNGLGTIEKDKYIRILFHETTNVGAANTWIFEGTKKIIP
jgi:EGF-like domain